jgi:hypothetical protein
MTTQTIVGALRIKTEEFATGLTQISLWGPGSPGRLLALVETEHGLTGWFCHAGSEKEPLEAAFETRGKALGWAIRTASTLF